MQRREKCPPYRSCDSNSGVAWIFFLRGLTGGDAFGGPDPDAPNAAAMDLGQRKFTAPPPAGLMRLGLLAGGPSTGWAGPPTALSGLFIYLG